MVSGSQPVEYPYYDTTTASFITVTITYRDAVLFDILNKIEISLKRFRK